VGLKERAKHYPGQLSGGEQQRVAIARALVNSPEIIFADEPTGNLDSDNGAQVMDMLMGLSSEDGATLVVVTHDESIAEHGDRKLVIMDGRVAEEAAMA
jgi:predicted ABC-type transport system involved in lysophospholipase L1 biosynthesis ATPase subunit